MLDKEWIVYGDNALQMFHWLTPYIEKAGYQWVLISVPDSIGAWKITVYIANAN